jgi:hypothetical protein
MADQLSLRLFADINVSDHFFDSLRADYPDFEAWFKKKSAESAYVFASASGSLDGFLYLKIEDGPVDDVSPPLPPKRRLKVGTMKINAHGTKLGERFIKKIVDHAVREAADEIYVTVFPKHAGLVTLLNKYGFRKIGIKSGKTGVEDVLAKPMANFEDDLDKGYPAIHTKDRKFRLLAIHPEFHTKLFPDSKLVTDSPDIIADLTHANSIHKIYIAKMAGLLSFRPGDPFVIYRTGDGQGPAYYRSVATSLCVTEEVKTMSQFGSEKEYLDYVGPQSVFTDAELRKFWKSREYDKLIKFTYNVSFSKRPNRQLLINQIGLNKSARWSTLDLTKQQFLAIAELGLVDARLIVD